MDPLHTFNVLATNKDFCDPSIDLTEPNANSDAPSAVDMLEEYRKSRDESILRRSGKPPHVFVCRKLPAALVMNHLSSLNHNPEMKLSLAFCAGLIEVQRPDGDTLKPKRAKKPTILKGVEIPDEDDLIQRITDDYGSETIREIGSVIIQKAGLPKTAKGPFTYLGGLPHELSERQ